MPSRATRSELVVLVLVLWVQVESWAPATRLTQLDGSSLVLAASGLAMTLPLLARRRFPLPVAVGVAAVFAVHSVVLGPPDSPARVAALLVASWTLGARAALRPALVGLAAVLVLLLTDVDSVVDALFIAMLVGAPWLGGMLVRRYRLLTEELERQREATARYAAIAERARIAREMHDVLAHTLSTIAVQAEAADQFLDRPDRARPWVHGIAATVHEALADLRVVIGALRQTEPGDGATERPGDPATGRVPGLQDLAPLVDNANTAATTVLLETPDGVPEVSATVGMTAYRIVQEALTNVRRHARATRVSVALTPMGGGVEILVRDDGVGSRPGEGSGHGLRGMRERAALAGGHLHAGPCPSGGFQVLAWLPATVGAP